MKKKSFSRLESRHITAFTLLEIILVIVAVGIMVTVGIPSFQNFIENTKAKTCAANLETLKGALDMYALDHDTMPASLSQLPQEYLNKAFAGVLRQRGALRIKLGYFILNWQKRGMAYAAFLKDDLAKGNINLITCPLDPTAPADGGVSYGLNTDILGKSSPYYQSLGPTTTLIGDSNSDTFANDSELDKRHTERGLLSRTIYANKIQKSGIVLREETVITILPTSVSDDNAQCEKKCEADYVACSKVSQGYCDAQYKTCKKKCP